MPVQRVPPEQPQVGRSRGCSDTRGADYSRKAPHTEQPVPWPQDVSPPLAVTRLRARIHTGPTRAAPQPLARSSPGADHTPPRPPRVPSPLPGAWPVPSSASGPHCETVWWPKPRAGKDAAVGRASCEQRRGQTLAQVSSSLHRPSRFTDGETEAPSQGTCWGPRCGRPHSFTPGPSAARAHTSPLCCTSPQPSCAPAKPGSGMKGLCMKMGKWDMRVQKTHTEREA